MNKINVEEALKKDYVFIDVRTPKEFKETTVPGAINIPLFTNEERAIIGTLYTKEGKEEAIEKGVEFVSKKLKDIIKKFTKYKEKKIVVFCWRGGMRSNSIVSLLGSIGFNVKQLDGGHKEYRRYVREYFQSLKLKQKLVVVCGLTGTGKTSIIKQLKNSIDLEDLAQHRSSLFGGIGLKPRSQKMFEALLFANLRRLKDEKYILVEGESRKIGNVEIPDRFFQAMEKGVKINVEDSMKNRVKRIVKDYGDLDHKEIAKTITVLKQKLGRKKIEELLDLLKKNDLEAVAEILLKDYYDPLYSHSLENIKYDLIVKENHVNEIKEFLSLELSKQTKKEIKEARAEIKAGKFHTLSEVKKELKI